MRLLAILPLFNILMATVQNHCYFSYWHIYTNGRLYLSPRSLENMDVVHGAEYQNGGQYSSSRYVTYILLIFLLRASSMTRLLDLCRRLGKSYNTSSIICCIFPEPRRTSNSNSLRPTMAHIESDLSIHLLKFLCF
jgi:hypothetical protein